MGSVFWCAYRNVMGNCVGDGCEEAGEYDDYTTQAGSDSVSKEGGQSVYAHFFQTTSPFETLWNDGGMSRCISCNYLWVRSTACLIDDLNKAFVVSSCSDVTPRSVALLL